MLYASVTWQVGRGEFLSCQKQGMCFFWGGGGRGETVICEKMGHQAKDVDVYCVPWVGANCAMSSHV